MDDVDVGRGLEGLKTGAEADITDSLGGWGEMALEARRLGGVDDRVDMLGSEANAVDVVAHC
jgi:hypothetical protein